MSKSAGVGRDELVSSTLRRPADDQRNEKADQALFLDENPEPSTSRTVLEESLQYSITPLDYLNSFEFRQSCLVPMPSPVRVLTAVPICDGHDSAINTINLEFIRHGIEVVYLGFHRYVSDIVRAAIQEDVAAIGISSYNGGHIDFFVDVVRKLKQKGASDIAVFGGGGGTITRDDVRQMKRKGVEEIFFAGTSLKEMVDYVRKHYARRSKRRPNPNSDLALARKLSEIEDAKGKIRNLKFKTRNPRRARVIGFTGPGGAGKTTLIDELVLRFLQRQPE